MPKKTKEKPEKEIKARKKKTDKKEDKIKDIKEEKKETREPKKIKEAKGDLAKKASKPKIQEIDIQELLKAGAHFGHQAHRWNPKMAPYIFTKRNNVHIIDLVKTAEKLKEALEFLYNVSANGGSVLFVGTKKQAQESIVDEATRAQMPYISHRWLGGMLTNFTTIKKRIDRLRELEEAESGQGLEHLPKKEVLKIMAERDKLRRNLGGIMNLNKVPDAVYVVDPRKEKIAVA